METTTDPATGAPGSPSPGPQQRLRVLHLLPDLAIGGGQTIVLHHVRRVDRSRFDVDVAYLYEDATMAGAFAEAGSPPLALGHRRTPAGVARTLARLVPLVRRADVLHVHSGPDRKLGQVAALLARRPVVGHLHAEWVHLGARWPDGAGAVRRARGRLMAAGRDAVERRTVKGYIAESDAVRRLFEPLVRAPLAVLNQSVAVERFDVGPAERASVRAELGLSEADPLVICVARMVAGKGHVALLEAMAAVPGAHLVVVGDGDLRPRVEAAVASMGLADRVHLLGDRFDVPRLLAAADVFAFASETEGFGLVVLEAMAARLPVAAFRLPAFEEFVDDGRTGHLVPLGDVDALAAAVRRLLAAPGTAREMGLRGRAVVEERFPSDAVARSFAPVHVAAASRSRRAGP